MERRRAFRKWLRMQPSNAIVGFAGWPFTTPLANWLDDVYSKPDDGLFKFGVANAIVRDGTFVRDLEPWEDKLMDFDAQLRRGAPVMRGTVEQWLSAIREDERNAAVNYAAVV